jgi:putative Ca2+/H+ antiporter (TMEM165/GDT1 family)
VNPRLVAALFAALFAFRVLSARVTLFPGLAVPAVIPAVAALLAVIVFGVWLIRRHARRFRSCPHPHPAWGAP